MKNFIIAAILIFVSSAFKIDQKLSINDFKPVFGEWKGSLTYLDYTTGKPFTMPANVGVSENASNNHQLILAYKYPNEPKANGNDTLTIDKTGLQLDKSLVKSKKQIDYSLEIITEENGKDGNDNKAAVIRKTYLISEKYFSIQKDVQFTGETNWIKRHMYTFER